VDRLGLRRAHAIGRRFVSATPEKFRRSAQVRLVGAVHWGGDVLCVHIARHMVVDPAEGAFSSVTSRWLFCSKANSPRLPPMCSDGTRAAPPCLPATSLQHGTSMRRRNASTIKKRVLARRRMTFSKMNAPVGPDLFDYGRERVLPDSPPPGPDIASQPASDLSHRRRLERRPSRPWMEPLVRNELRPSRPLGPMPPPAGFP